MILLLWTTFIISGLVVGLATVIRARLILMARAGKSGTEYIAMALNPLFLAAFLLEYAGGLSGLLLAVSLDGTGVRVTTGVLGGLLLAIGLLSAEEFFRAWWVDRKANSVISQDEMPN